MDSLTNKRIVLGVTGGIAAYKGAELVRRLRDAGAQVRVIMTPAATQFVTPLTFQALSGRPVYTQLLDADSEQAMGHIRLARWADLVLVAPASADFMARLTHGRADDLVAAICLAAEVPVALAPAMNQAMWQQAVTRENAATLAGRQVALWGPATGSQACGETGPGRMLEPEALVASCAAMFATGALAGTTVLVTAGPTREAIDPVRYLSNRSSGKMGYAVAAAAAEAGARVTLVSGPVELATPDRVTRVDVESAAEMHAAVMQRAKDHDIFISVAAVADFRPAEVAPHKLQKDASSRVLSLEPTADILADVAGLPGGPFSVGFAAETENVAAHAQAKLRGKSLDMIAANQVGGGTGVFGGDENALQVFWEGGSRELETAPKARLARNLIAIIAEQYYAKSQAENT